MAAESVVLNGLSLNDATNYSLLDIQFPPPRKRQEWVEGADADGSALVRDPLFSNREITLKLRVAPQANMDAALVKIGSIVDQLEEAENNPNGTALVWTPAGSSKSVTFYVLSGEIDEFGPITQQRWYRFVPEVTLRLQCKPFGYGAEVTVGSSTSTAPLIEYLVSGVTGDVPAEGRLVVTDNATQSRRHVEWGLQQRYYSAGVPRILDTFATDTIGAGNYTFDTGSGTLSVSGGLLVPSSTAEKRLYRNDSGVASYTDIDTTVKVTTGASVASGSTGVFARRVDGSNFLHGNLNFAGAASTLTIVLRTAAVDATKATSAVFTPVAATSYWLRLQVQGTSVTLGYYTTDPRTGSAAAQSTTYTLSAGEATTFATGQVGMRLIPQATDYRWDDFRIDPLAGSTSLLLDSEGLVTTGFAGTQTTRTGAYTGGTVANHVIRGTPTNSPVAICGTGNLGHVGTFRVKARVYANSAISALGSTFKVRFTWKEGDGALRSNDYTFPVVAGGWCEVDLGMITVPEKTLGTQRWTGQVEAYASAAGETLDVDYLLLIPAQEGYAKARVPICFLAPTSFSGRDEFDQTAGNLNGKTLPVGGGNWTTSGDATDLAVEATGHTAQRSTTGDTLGRTASAPVGPLTDTLVSIDFKWSTVAAGPSSSVYARSQRVQAGIAAGPVFRLDADGTVLTSASLALNAGAWYTIRLIALSNGTLAAMLAAQGSSAPIVTLVASDPRFATGGLYESGLVAFKDGNASATAVTRNYDNFWVAVPTPDAVVFSGRAAEIRHDSAIRQDSTGTYYGPINTYRGSRFLLPPAGSANRISRLGVKARRADIDVTQDDQIADSTTVAVRYTPRFSVIPR